MTPGKNNCLPGGSRRFSDWRSSGASRVLPLAVIAFIALAAIGAWIVFRKGGQPDEPAKLVAQGTRIESATTSSPPASVAVATNSVPAASPPALTPDGYLEVGFDRLSAFPPRWSPVTTNPITLAWIPKLVNPVPDEIKALEGKNVAVRGFMLPLKQVDGLTTEFTIMKNQQFCCYGKPLELNEWAFVRMKGPGVKSLMDQPVVIYGTLRMGERMQSQMVGFYEIDGDKLELPPAPK